MIPLSVFSNRHCGGGVQDIGTFGFFLSVGALVNEDEKKNKKFRQGPTWVQIDLYLYY